LGFGRRASSGQIFETTGASQNRDLRVPPSNHFEKLRGKLEGFHSIRVDSQWRLIFRWDGGRGEASGVYLDDHSYR
jgi:toxin HigB-1